MVVSRSLTPFEVVVCADFVDCVDRVSDGPVNLLVLDVHPTTGVRQVL